MTKVLNREAILAADKRLGREEISVPEWGGKVLVRELGAADSIEISRDGDQIGAAFRALLRSVVDESGECVFTDDDLPIVRALSQRSFRNLCDAMGRLNGADAAGNSGATPGADLPTA